MPPRTKKPAQEETATNEEAQAMVAAGEAEPGPEVSAEEAAEAGDDPKEKPEHPPAPKRRLVVFQSNCAGVFAGELASHEGHVVVLKNARRLWSWGRRQLAEVAAAGLNPKERTEVLGVEAEVVLKDTRLADPKAYHVFDLSEAAHKSIFAAPVYAHPKAQH